MKTLAFNPGPCRAHRRVLPAGPRLELVAVPRGGSRAVPRLRRSRDGDVVVSRPLTARLTSRLGPVGAKFAGQPVVLTNVVGVAVGVATLSTSLPADLKAGIVTAIVGVVTLFVPSQVVPVDKLDFHPFSPLRCCASGSMKRPRLDPRSRLKVRQFCAAPGVGGQPLCPIIQA